MHSIAQFGTFEVENYGDRLFPIILEKALASRLDSFRIQLYSPLENASNNVASISVAKGPSLFPVHDVPRTIIVGGGDLVTFATSAGVSTIYRRNWSSNIGPLTACWATSAIKKPSGSTLMWNALGVPSPFTTEQAAFVCAIAAQVDYLSVRDETSLLHLRQAGVDNKITIVPDTALILPEYFPATGLKQKAESIFRPFGLAPGEPIVFQLAPIIKEKEILKFVATLKPLKRMLGRQILLLPLGFCHEDDVLLANFKTASNGEFFLLTEKLDAISTAAVIAHAGCFIGSSLHGNITAYAYGVPHLIYKRFELTKLQGFARLIQEDGRLVSSLEELMQQSSLLRQQPSRSVYQKLVEQVHTHFDRIAESILHPSQFEANVQNSQLLEEYLYLLTELQEMRPIKQSNAWRLLTLIEKYGFRPPFIRWVGKRLLALYRGCEK